VKRGPGLFTGWWTDIEGNRTRKILRNEFGELYRLYRICTQYEKQDQKALEPLSRMTTEAPIGSSATNDEKPIA
jgi:hypothetical protein